MAVIRDMMPTFELLQPTSVEDTVALLERYGERSWVLAGGLDSLDWLKDRVKRPEAVVELGGVEELRGVRATSGGLEIGALTTVSEVATHPEIVERFGLLSTAAGHVATPQIRNQGTIGGNISQDTRCWYYRGGWPCYRAGGNTCYAATPQSMNREHCVFGANRCVAVNTSDTAPALIALDAELVIRSADGERVVAAEDYFLGPEIDITRMTVLEPGDLLTRIRLPGAWAGAKFYFEKVRDRQSWDFALVNVASAIVTSGGRVERARIAINGVAPTPVRLHDVEDLVQGMETNEDTAAAAGELAVRGAGARCARRRGSGPPTWRSSAAPPTRGDRMSWSGSPGTSCGSHSSQVPRSWSPTGSTSAGSGSRCARRRRSCRVRGSPSA
jgi:xanthine dehydrogenase YagS FAD-binding subunit